MREVINFGFNGGLKFYIGTTKYWLGTVGGREELIRSHMIRHPLN